MIFFFTYILLFTHPLAFFTHSLAFIPIFLLFHSFSGFFTQPLGFSPTFMLFFTHTFAFLLIYLIFLLILWLFHSRFCLFNRPFAFSPIFCFFTHTYAFPLKLILFQSKFCSSLILWLGTQWTFFFLINLFPSPPSFLSPFLAKVHSRTNYCNMPPFLTNRIFLCDF